MTEKERCKPASVSRKDTLPVKRETYRMSEDEWVLV